MNWEFIFEFYKHPFIIFIVVGGLISFIFYNKIVGMFGELYVKKELKKLSNDYLIINDLMVKVNNKTSQMDHVIISKYGIFVIETKKYNGYIIGNDYDKQWKYKSGKKIYYINNPIHQNYGHIMSLKEILNLSKEMFISIVSIDDTAKLNVKSNNVVYLSKLVSKIKSYDKVILNDYINIYDKLNSININDIKERKEHIKNIKKNKKSNH